MLVEASPLKIVEAGTQIMYSQFDPPELVAPAGLQTWTWRSRRIQGTWFSPVCPWKPHGQGDSHLGSWESGVRCSLVSVETLYGWTIGTEEWKRITKHTQVKRVDSCSIYMMYSTTRVGWKVHRLTMMQWSQHSLPCSPHTSSIGVAALGFLWYGSSHPDPRKSPELQIRPHHQSDHASQPSVFFFMLRNRK